jgi:hypothetical protein
VLLVALLASGCAGGDDSATETVIVTTATTVTVTETTTETTTTQGQSGTLPVAAFNARAERVDEPWERDLAKVTDEFLALGEQESGSRSFQSSSSGDSATASLLIDGLSDDSVRARSYDLTFTRRADGTWRIASARWAQRCQQGRGHQTFSPEPCV